MESVSKPLLAWEGGGAIVEALGSDVILDVV